MSLYHLSYVDGSGRGHYAASPAFDDINTPLLSQNPFIASYATLTPSHIAAEEEREDEQQLTDDAQHKPESYPLLPSRDGRQQHQQQQQQQQQSSSTFILPASPSHSRRSRSDFHSGMRGDSSSRTQLSQSQLPRKQTTEQQTAAATTAAASGDKLQPEAWRRGHPAPVIPVSPSLSTSLLRPADVTVTSYESPMSGLSSYHSDYSSPFSPLAPRSPSPLLLRVLVSSLSSLATVLRWPCSHPEHALLLFLSLCIIASSSMEQTLRKTLTSSLYNYRAALFLASAFASCVLSCSLCALHWRQVKSQLTEPSLPLLPLLLLMLLDSCHCLFLFLSMAVLPAPLALLLPQLMLPCTLISSALLHSQHMERTPLLGCVLVLLSLALATGATAQSLPVSPADAFSLSKRELWCNILLMLLATLAATASYHCKHRLLCRHSVQPQLLNAVIAAGQLVLAVIVVPLAIRMQYLGTNRYSEAQRTAGPGGAGGGAGGERSGHGGQGGGGEAALPPALPVGAGSRSNSSSSTAQPSRSTAGRVGISSSSASRTSSVFASLSSDASASSSSSASPPLPAAADVSVAASTAEQAAPSASSPTTAPSSASDIASSSDREDISASAASSSAAAWSPESSSSSSAALPAAVSVSSSSRSFLPLPSSTSSSAFSILLSLVSFSPPPSSREDAPFLLPMIPSPGYLPASAASPSAAQAAAAGATAHSSSLLNLRDAAFCLIGRRSELGDHCTPWLSLLLQLVAFVAMCVLCQYAMRALQSRPSASVSAASSSSPPPFPLLLPVSLLVGLLLSLASFLPSSPIASLLPSHQQFLLRYPPLLLLSIAALSLGVLLCFWKEEKAVEGVDVWQRVEGLMREEEGRSRARARSREAGRSPSGSGGAAAADSGRGRDRAGRGGRDSRRERRR